MNIYFHNFYLFDDVPLVVKSGTKTINIGPLVSKFDEKKCDQFIEEEIGFLKGAECSEGHVLICRWNTGGWNVWSFGNLGFKILN